MYLRILNIMCVCFVNNLIIGLKMVLLYKSVFIISYRNILIFMVFDLNLINLNNL